MMGPLPPHKNQTLLTESKRVKRDEVCVINQCNLGEKFCCVDRFTLQVSAVIGGQRVVKPRRFAVCVLDFRM
jgi:hypothetical protein